MRNKLGYLNSPSLRYQRHYKVVYRRNKIISHEEKTFNPFGSDVDIYFNEAGPALLMPLDGRHSFYFSFDITMSRDQVIYERADYTILMLLGDVTALFEGLYLTGFFVMFGILQGKVLRDNYVIN